MRKLFSSLAALASLVAITLAIGGSLLWEHRDPLAHWALISLEQRFPPWRNTSSRPVTGIIALGGSFNGLRSPGERVMAAVRLAKAFPKAKVVYSGREETAGGAGEREAFLVDGIAPDRIVVEDRSANTAENATFSASLLRPTADERWILVTSAFHMPRAIAAFRAAGFAAEAYPVEYLKADVTAEARIALKEVFSLIYYRLAGRSVNLYPAP